MSPISYLKRHRFLLLISLSVAVVIACKPAAEKGANASSLDPALQARYLENGAWTVRYFSPEYQAYLDSAITLSPTSAYLYQQKAMPYFKLGKFEMGLKYMDRAVELDEQIVDYRAFVKCIFGRQYLSALEDFEKAKKLKGLNGYVMDHSYDFYIGLCHLQLNNFTEAHRSLLSSIAYQQSSKGDEWVHPLDLFYAGIALQELGVHPQAVDYFNECLDKNPNFADAKYYKSLSLFRMKQVEEAERLLDESASDFAKGYTINEDNAAYEVYPYQIKKFYIDMVRLTKQ
jgi:tetratricopeptide (TPR) repeat protein